MKNHLTTQEPSPLPPVHKAMPLSYQQAPHPRRRWLPYASPLQTEQFSREFRWLEQTNLPLHKLFLPQISTTILYIFTLFIKWLENVFYVMARNPFQTLNRLPSR